MKEDENTKTTKLEILRMFSKKYFRYFDAYLKIALGSRPRKKIPQLVFNTNSEEIFTNDKIVQIGLQSIMYALCDSEDDEQDKEKENVITTEFLLGHEAQHCLSTTTKYWVWGLNQGVIAICQEISDKLEGKGKRHFRKDGDVEKFCRDMAIQHNLLINEAALTYVCHSIQNSIEDGRIERIRASKSPGFKANMLYVRAKQWLKLNTKYVFGDLPEEKDLEDHVKLAIILQQIISLATMGLYQRGYLEKYQDSDMTMVIDSLSDSIRKGVTSPNCKGAMMAAVEIEKRLADLIIEACTKNVDGLSRAVNSIVQNMSDQFSPDLKTNEEETGEDIEETAGSPAEAKEASDTDVGEAAESKEASDTDAGEAAEAKEASDTDAGEAAESKAKDTEKPDAENSGVTSDSDELNSEGYGEVEKGEDTNEDANEDANSNKKSAFSVEDIAELAKASKHSFMPNGVNAVNSRGARNVGDSAEGISSEEFEKTCDIIKDAMRHAAEKAFENARQIGSAAPAKPNWDEKQDNSDPVTAESLGMPAEYGEIYFAELKRGYSVDYDLPVDLEGRAAKFKNKVERLFKNQVAPVVKAQESGKVDPSSVYKLLMKQTDFYIKKGQTPKFNGVGYLLQDNSGSMGVGRGSAREYACEGMAIIEEAFKNIMPLKIAAFDSEGYNAVTHEVVKNFDEKLHKNCAYNFFLGGRTGYGNKDGYSIRIATKELLSRPEKEKILIIASDGCPCCYENYSDGLADVHDAVKDARKAGIKVVGIYFSVDGPNEDFGRMYEYDYVCTTPDRIEEELQSIFQKFVFS